MNRPLAVLIVAAFSLFGCTPLHGPLADPQNAALAQREVLRSDESVLFHAPAAWVKDQYGFRNMNPYAVALSGALVLGDKHLAFAMWDEKTASYVRLVHLPYTAITKTELDTFGRGRALVVIAGEAFYTFGITLPESPLVDQETSERAHQILMQKTSK